MKKKKHISKNVKTLYKRNKTTYHRILYIEVIETCGHRFNLVMLVGKTINSKTSSTIDILTPTGIWQELVNAEYLGLSLMSYTQYDREDVREECWNKTRAEYIKYIHAVFG